MLFQYDESFILAADLDYFLTLSRIQSIRVSRSDCSLVRMSIGGVSGLEHRRRISEVRRAYRLHFGPMWALPFLARYMQRFLTIMGIK